MMLQQNLQTLWDGKRADNFLGILFHAYVSGATRLDHGLTRLPRVVLGKHMDAKINFNGEAHG